MSPARVEIRSTGEASSEEIVPNGQSRDIGIGSIKATINCDSEKRETEVSVSGTNLSWVITRKGEPMRSVGEFAGGCLLDFLREEGDTVRVNEIGSTIGLTVTHTEHDGSTGEVG